MPTLADFAPSDEAVLARWEGTLLDSHGSEEVVLATTDRCVVFCSEGGRAGIFPREHVSAIESRVGTEVSYDGLDYRALVGVGAALSVVTFLGAVLASSGLATLLLTVVAAGGLWVMDHGWSNRERYDGIERRAAAVEHVTIRSDAGASREFVFPMEHRAGVALGEFVRSG